MMKLSKKLYVVSALTLVAALGLGLTSGVSQPVPPPAGDTLDLTVFQVETVQCFKAKIIIGKDGSVSAVSLPGERRKIRLSLPNGQALVKRGVIAAGTIVKVEGFDTNGRRHKHRGHVTVLK